MTSDAPRLILTFAVVSMADFILPESLTPLSSGRLFIRSARAATQPEYPAPPVRLPDAALLIGVVEVPRTIEFERLHTCRINHRVWMDTNHSRPPRLPDHVAECGIGDVIRDQQFAMPALPDACEVFVRRTMLPHEQEHLCWAYIGAALATRPPALPADGTYEFDQDGFRLVDSNCFIGEAPDGILRACLWGPDGRFGLATSMEPEAFQAWLPGERARIRAKDPQFAAFEERMEALCGPLPMCYTREEQGRRDSVAQAVIREIVLAERRGELDALADTLGITTAERRSESSPRPPMPPRRSR